MKLKTNKQTHSPPPTPRKKHTQIKTLKNVPEYVHVELEGDINYLIIKQKKKVSLAASAIHTESVYALLRSRKKKTCNAHALMHTCTRMIYLALQT